MPGRIEIENEQRFNAFRGALEKVIKTGHEPMGHRFDFELDFVVDWFNRKLEPRYEKRRLEDYLEHVKRHFEEHRRKAKRGNQPTLWVPPRYKDFGRPGRPRNEALQEFVEKRWRKGDLRPQITAAVRREFPRIVNVSSAVGRALARISGAGRVE